MQTIWNRCHTLTVPILGHHAVYFSVCSRVDIRTNYDVMNSCQLRGQSHHWNINFLIFGKFSHLQTLNLKRNLLTIHLWDILTLEWAVNDFDRNDHTVINCKKTKIISISSIIFFFII